MRKRQASDSGRSTALRDAWRVSRGGFAALLVFGAVLNLLKFASPLYLLQVLDRVPASRSLETLIMLTLIALVAVIAAVILDAVRRGMVRSWSGWIELRLGPPLLRAGLSSGPQETGDRRGALDALSRLRDFVSNGLLAWLDVVWAPIFMLGVYLVHAGLGVFSGVSVALLITLGVLEELSSRGPRQRARAGGAEARDVASAAERHHETVAGLSMTEPMADLWREAAERRAEDSGRAEGRRHVFRALIRGLGEASRIGVIGVGMWLVLADELTLGGVFAARVMFGFGFRLIERALGAWRRLRDARSAYAAIARRLDEAEPAPVSAPEALRVAPIMLESVGHRYQGQRAAVLKALTLTLNPGEMLLVTGPSASGKSTLSRLLVGLVSPRNGRVRLGDVDIARLPDAIRRELIGYLPQVIELFPTTVRRNIAALGEGRYEDVTAAAKRAGVHESILRLPQGYDTELTPGAMPLSGGEIKRVALARALYGAPRLVVLDEPMANMDRVSGRMLADAIRALKQSGASVILTTPRSPAGRLARLADTVLILGGAEPEITAAVSGSTAPRRGGGRGLRAVT